MGCFFWLADALKNCFAFIRNRTAVLAGISAAFAVLQLVSAHIWHYQLFRYSSVNAWIFNILLLITFFVLYFAGGSAVYWAADRCREDAAAGSSRVSKSGHGLLYFLVILLGWSPWLYAFYPGTLWSDMCYEYDQYYGAYRFDSAMQFPPFPTWVMGVLMDLGKARFGSDNAGMFLYILLQTLVCAFACVKALTLLDEIRVKRGIVRLLLCVYAFFPDFGVSAQQC